MVEETDLDTLLDGTSEEEDASPWGNVSYCLCTCCCV